MDACRPMGETFYNCELMRLVAYAFCYCDPVRLEAVDKLDPRYKERKIIYADKFKVIGLEDGFKVQYNIQVYEFNNVLPDDQKIKTLWNYINANPKGKYKGWLHHINLYWPTRPKKKFWGQRKF